MEDKELREMLLNDPRSETDRTKDLKCQIGVKCIKYCGRVFLQEGELPDWASSAISEVVTKKGHLLGVGRKHQWELLGVNEEDLKMISSLREKFPGKTKGNFCYEYFHTIKGHCACCHGEFYTDMATCLACADAEK